ncbi:MAG: efflux RND transporter periplasmic adaptor subunit [Desulfotalea sp.]
MIRFSILLTLCFVLLTNIALSSEKLKKGDVDPKNGKIIKYWVAPMDPTYIRDEPGQSPMGMDLVPKYEEAGGEKLPSSTIRIDPVTIQNMGVRIKEVSRGVLTKSIRALGTVTYDETRVHVVTSKFDGWVEKLHVDFVGQQVTKGQPLFQIYSPELVSAQDEYLLALEQKKNLSYGAFPSIKKNAKSLLAATKRKLLYWDISPAQLKHLEKNGVASKALTVYSPANGIVTEKEAVEGHFVKAGMHQYEIADLSQVWVDVDIYEYELPYLKLGMTAEMNLSYLPGKSFAGKVLFIYPFLDAKTRTVRARLSFDNSEGLLMPNMYGNVFLNSTISKNAIIISQEAVIDSGLRKIVFISQGEGKFEPREIELGVEGENNTFQVLRGLEVGEQLVVSAQFMFDSESRLREAIQKMLEARNSEVPTNSLSLEDLDMDSMSMDELDMTELKVDDK